VPADAGLAFLDVQYLDSKHTSRLREILAGATAMSVVEARHGMAVEADHLHAIPPNRALLLRDRRLRIEKRQNGIAHFMPVDTLFRSLALEERNPLDRRHPTDIWSARPLAAIGETPIDGERPMGHATAVWVFSVF
jgi:hypothetical protein